MNTELLDRERLVASILYRLSSCKLIARWIKNPFSSQEENKLSLNVSFINSVRALTYSKIIHLSSKFISSCARGLENCAINVMLIWYFSSKMLCEFLLNPKKNNSDTADIYISINLAV